MDNAAIIAFAGGIFSLILASAPVLLKSRTPAQWAFAAGMAVLGAESIFTGLSANASSPEAAIYWQVIRFMAMAVLPGTWLLFSLSYSRGNYREFLKHWRPAIILAFLLPAGLAFGFGARCLFRVQQQTFPYDWILVLRWPGVLVHVLVLAGSIVILMNLERTFRACVGTMRWRIKFMVLGIALLFAVRLFTSSQCLLYSRIDLSLQRVDAVALLLTCALSAFALARGGLLDLEVYPSRSLIHNSLAVLLAGIYLLVAGVLARIVHALGGSAAVPLTAFFVLVSLVVLAMLLLSERLREQTKRWVSRQFQRPHYDYRRIWSTFTERTHPAMAETDLSRAVAQWLSETFHVLSVTLWLAEEPGAELRFGASTSLPESTVGEILDLAPETSDLIRSMRGQSYPVDMEESPEPWVAALRQYSPGTFSQGAHRICVPLMAGGELCGFITLGDRVNGIPFSVEELDLLKCIGDQVASRLLRIRLSHKLMQAREMEAFQTMSTFFVHDLKNTAATLSLMLQNLPAHFENPAFREDALRAISRIVAHLNQLIGRLSLLRQQPELQWTDADLNEVVHQALGALEGASGVRLVKTLGSVPKVKMDPEQMQKVMVNLVLNAKEACGEGGEIRVQTGTQKGWAMLSVSDNGCGMTAEFIQRSLFRPFQTTKKKGIGIGMFQSKRIVEAHRGKIEVESEPGKGTTFRVLLPLKGETQ